MSIARINVRKRLSKSIKSTFLPMGCHVAFDCKCLTTRFTAEWSFTGVYPFVHNNVNIDRARSPRKDIVIK